MALWLLHGYSSRSVIKAIQATSSSSCVVLGFYFLRSLRSRTNGRDYGVHDMQHGKVANDIHVYRDEILRKCQREFDSLI